MEGQSATITVSAGDRASFTSTRSRVPEEFAAAAGRSLQTVTPNRKAAAGDGQDSAAVLLVRGRCFKNSSFHNWRVLSSWASAAKHKNGTQQAIA